MWSTDNFRCSPWGSRPGAPPSCGPQGGLYSNQRLPMCLSPCLKYFCCSGWLALAMAHGTGHVLPNPCGSHLSPPAGNTPPSQATCRLRPGFGWPYGHALHSVLPSKLMLVSLSILWAPQRLGTGLWASRALPPFLMNDFVNERMKQ